MLNAKFYFYDEDTSTDIEAHLHRTDLKGSWDPDLAMADLASSSSPGYATDTEPVARYEVIDNSNYAYWVYYRMPPRTEGSTTVHGRDLTISYRARPEWAGSIDLSAGCGFHARRGWAIL